MPGVRDTSSRSTRKASSSSPQRRWPPSSYSSSTSKTCAPALPAATAAAIPAGPPPGLDEGLVVETDGEKAAEGPIGRLHVVLQRGPDPLGTYDHARLYAPVGAPDIRLVVHLHHATRVQEARR